MDSIRVVGTLHTSAYREILSPDAQRFLIELHKKFNDRRRSLLQARKQRAVELLNGKLPDFLPETEWIRNSEWKCAPIPKDLMDRR